MTSPESANLLNMSNFSQKLIERRKQLGYSQGDLARLTGFAQSRISKWENGEGEPGPSQLVILAVSLKTTLDYLCFDAVTDPGTILSELSEEEKFAWGLISRLGAEEAINRMLAAPEPGDKKRADTAPEGTPSQPNPGPSYAKPISVSSRKRGSTE